MLNIVLWICVGTFIGWNFPQPSWTKSIQAWLTAKIKSLIKK